MDDFGWGNPTMSTNYMTSSMWTNCDKFPGSMVECRSSANENVQLLSPAPTSSCFSELVGILAPTTSSATGGLDADMLQYQDAVGSDSTVAAQKSRLLYERFTPINGAKSAGGPTSVDVSCLTEPFPSSSAAKNDEDLSAILHGCENLRNFDCSTNNSSESNRDEVVSQCSSNPESLRARKPRGTAGGGRRRREDCARSGEKDHHLLPGSKKSKSWSAKEAEGFRISFRSAPGHVSDDRGGSELLDREEEEDDGYEPDTEAIAQVKEMIYKAAALRPVSLGTEEAVEKPKRKNVRISSDPQTVAARHRRERISERLRVLQRLVPGGSKMDTASMLDEAANYLKFLKSQVTAMESLGNNIVINNNNSSSSSSRWFDYGAVLATISTTTTTATAPFQLPLSHAFAMQGLCHNPIPVASKRLGTFPLDLTIRVAEGTLSPLFEPSVLFRKITNIVGEHMAERERERAMRHPSLQSPQLKSGNPHQSLPVQCFVLSFKEYS